MLKTITALAVMTFALTTAAEAKHRHHHHRHYSSHHHHKAAHKKVRVARSSSSAVGLVPQLAAKVEEIKQSCGSSLISGVRHTLVAGTRTMSLHASGRAADVQGNPSCIYAHLKGWTGSGGGYSTDYGHVNHVHISYGGREAGITFRHGGGTRYASRGRHHGHTRYASLHFTPPDRLAPQ